MVSTNEWLLNCFYLETQAQRTRTLQLENVSRPALMEDIIRIIQKDEFWVPWGELMFKMKKCYDRENASSDINECLKLY